MRQLRRIVRGRRVLAGLTLSLGLLLGSAAVVAGPASAAGQTLTLSDGPYGSWTAAGSGFSSARADVQLWVMDVSNGGWSTLEYQSGLTTSRFSCGLTYCTIGGRLSAKGALRWVPPGGLFGGYWTAVKPLSCGHSYQPVAYDPADGYVYGSVFTEAACPILH